MAGSRWTVESNFEAAKGEVGLAQYGSAELDGLVSAYHARDVGVGPADRDARRDDRGRNVKKSLRSPTQASLLAPFKAKRGLASP